MGILVLWSAVSGGRVGGLTCGLEVFSDRSFWYRFAAAIARTQHEWSRQFPQSAAPEKAGGGGSSPPWPPYPYYCKYLPSTIQPPHFPFPSAEQELLPQTNGNISMS